MEGVLLVWRNVEKRKLRFEGVEAFRRVIIRQQEEFGCLLSAYAIGFWMPFCPLALAFCRQGAGKS